jgi:hypothetical protein
MSETAPIATVVYRVVEGGQLGLMTAVLVRTPEGACWAYPNEADIGKDPIAAGALPLDERHLELIPPQTDVPPAYLYRGVIHVPQPKTRLPPSLLASTRPKASGTIQKQDKPS